MLLRMTAIIFLLLAGMVNGRVHAEIIIQASVTPLSGNLFRYTFRITNTGPDDVLMVTVNGAPLQDLTIQATLSASPGFVANYDANLGLVDFLEDSGLFQANTTKSGFRFDSAIAPTPGMLATFEAISVQFGMATGSVEFGDGGNLIFRDQFEPG